MDWRGKWLYFQTLVQKTKENWRAFWKEISDTTGEGGEGVVDVYPAEILGAMSTVVPERVRLYLPLVPWVQPRIEDNEKRQISSEHKKWLFIYQVFQRNREGEGDQVEAGQNILE